MIPSQPAQNPTDFKMENITREELKKIQKSMKKPQFMGLLNQYMIEISDPKNKQEYDEYLRQMQREGQLPKNMTLVQLTPHFCIRTSIVSEKNKKHNMKFFINFCSTQFLDEPLCEPSLNEEGKTAFGWKVPNSMGKIRYDQDKGGNPCQVADVAFNHKAFQIIQAQNNLPFRKNQFKSMIISIGLQCAQKQLGQRKQTLSKDYDILKNLKCKGGKPALLPLRYIKGKAYNKGQSPQQNSIQRDTEGKQTKLQKQINNLKQKSEQEKIKQEQQTQQNEMQEQLEDKKVLVQDLDAGIQQPKYSSIYTYPIDYSEFLQDPSQMNAKKVPSHFTVEFKLPRVEGMQQIGGDALNVNENRVVLKIGEKYFIDLPFEAFKMKYKITTQKVKAKFDKKKKCLKLIFPIDQSIKYHQEQEKIRANIQQIGQQKDGQSQVVENQTWKNKVLQVTEPTVDLKIIEQVNAKQEPLQSTQKKLVQQIDQDDYPEEEKDRNQNTTANNEPLTFEQALDQQKNKAFTLRKYYQTQNQKQPQPTQTQQIKQKPNSLTYVFQQTSDKVVLIIKMMNYKKEDLKVIYNQLQNNNFFIQWNQNHSQQQDMTKVHLLNFKIDQNYVTDLKKVEIVFRVNFLAIFLHKTTLNKFWEKESIITVGLVQSQTQKEYEIFINARDQVQKCNNEKASLQKAKYQQMRQKQPKQLENNMVASEPKKNIQNQLSPAIQSTTGQNQRKIYEVDNEVQNKKSQQSSKLQGEYFSFNNLPPQFIQFDMNFVEIMD